MTPKKTFWLAGGVILACLTLANPAKSQITPDGTTDTKVDNDCLNSCNITGGTLAGENLFHSFQQFNVGAGESVYFAAPNVANIFSRVTGGELSRIFGKLGVSGGDANLFLLNPNGIIFGAGAELDVNGSFVATTADEIQFGDRGFLTATPDGTENLALLTVNPSAFFFNQMGQPNPIATQSGAKLTVPQKQNITLLGGQPGEDVKGILLRGATLQAPAGKVSLGSVQASASVGIDPDFQLQFADEGGKGDITLTQGSTIDVSGIGSGSVNLQGDRINLAQKSKIVADTLGDVDGGDISFHANNLTIRDNSFISTSTRGMGKGGNINIFAAEGMEVAGANVAALQQFIGTSLAGGEPERDLSSTVHTATYGSGASGDIKIETQQLQINNGAWMISSTVDRGNGGDIAIETDNSTVINGSGIFTGSSARGSGIPGNLTIDTQNLLLQNSGVVSSSTLGQSAGGNLAITASESVRLQQTLPGTIIPTGIYSNTILGSAKAGNLTIDTQKLIVEDGSQLSSASGLITNEILLPLGGDGGDITINAAESVEISGKSEDGNFFSSIVNDTRSNNPAGDLKIDTGSLIVRDDGLISASSIRSGNGGNVTLNASESVELFGSGTGALQQIILDGLAEQLNITGVTGGIFSITVAGEAGNIAINAPKLTLSEGAIISTASLGRGTAGDLSIEASEKLNIIGSAIASPTLGSGDAGKITIDTSNLVLREGGLIATATLTEGDAGDLSINASESIELLDTSSNLLFAGTISSGSYGGQGLVGDLTIDTQNLIIKNGAGIDSTSTIFPGLPMVVQQPTTDREANLTINASESITISGSSPVDNAGSRIFSTTTTAAPASNINIATDRLAVFDGAEIAVNSAGEGSAGSLSVMANSIDLENGGNFNATTLSGKGGNISLKLNDILQLNNQAVISTNAFGEGNGGNISIDADFAIVAENSQITAQAIAGQGGNIDIKAQDIFVTSNSDISASSELGIDGEVNIQTFTNVQRNNLSQLPATLIAVDQNIVQKCSNNGNSKGVFSYVGRGGLPPNPLGDRFTDNSVIADLDIPEASNPNSEVFEPETSSHDFSLAKTNATNEVIEAQGWFRNEQGKIILTAQGDRSNSEFIPDSCPFKG